MIVRVKIQGRVQGVWFRAWTKEQADALGLAGWVTNCFDGSVEAHFEGPDESVQEMLRRCHEGPPLASVTGVEESPDEACGRQGFRVI